MAYLFLYMGVYPIVFYGRGSCSSDRCRIVIDEEIVLLERNHPPFEGYWVLPGGLVEPGETAREACVREVTEEVGLDVTVDGFVGLYDDPDRDERGNVSAAYRCSPLGGESPTPQEEARQVRTFHPTDLPETGFDPNSLIRMT